MVNKVLGFHAWSIHTHKMFEFLTRGQHAAVYDRIRVLPTGVQVPSTSEHGNV